jgi:hypothetical protein
MTNPGNEEPPRHVAYSLDEALELLADLEDARDGLIDSGYLVPVVGIENQVRLLSRRLGFDDMEEDSDGD